ncbi:hypothetical protein HDZ31DRAFT_69328 [Schizophyllum fasciatum]
MQLSQALLLLCVGAAALTIPVERRAACAPVMLIHAPGTNQQGLGSVGEPLAAGLARGIPGLTALGLPYNSSAEYLVTPAEGAKLLANTVESQLAACPEQKFILSGYSKYVPHLFEVLLIDVRHYQGRNGCTPWVACIDKVTPFANAMITIVSSSRLMAQEKAKVCGVSVFGDPYDKDGLLGILGLDDTWPIANAAVGGNVIEYVGQIALHGDRLPAS